MSRGWGIIGQGKNTVICLVRKATKSNHKESPETHLELGQSGGRSTLNDFLSQEQISISLWPCIQNPAGGHKHPGRTDCRPFNVWDSWVKDYLTGRLQSVRLQDCVSRGVVTWPSECAGSLPVHHLVFWLRVQFFLVTYRCFRMSLWLVDQLGWMHKRLVGDFAKGCSSWNHLQLNTGKTRTLATDKSPSHLCDYPWGAGAIL